MNKTEFCIRKLFGKFAIHYGVNCYLFSAWRIRYFNRHTSKIEDEQFAPLIPFIEQPLGGVL